MLITSKIWPEIVLSPWISRRKNVALVIKVFLSMEETNLQQNITTHCGGGYRQLLKGGDAGREGEYISVELCA